MNRVLPDRPIVELEDSNQIFHSVYDLDNRYQVPGARYLNTGVTYKCEDCPARWRGAMDGKGRVIAAMTFVGLAPVRSILLMNAIRGTP